MSSLLFGLGETVRLVQRVYLIALVLALPLAAVRAQEASPFPVADLPGAKVASVKKIPGGGLLFAIRLCAAKSKPLALARPPIQQRGGEPGEADPVPFSLAASTVKDFYSGKVYQALPDVPRDPYVGPIDTTSTLSPGGWLQLGVAFPPIPPPPLDKDGKKQPYHLLFSVPELKIETTVKLDPESLQPILKNP